MTYKELLKFWESDLQTYSGHTSPSLMQKLKTFIKIPGFKYTFYLRLCQYLKTNKVHYPLYLLSRAILLHYQYKFGIQICPSTKIGHGLCILHYNCIVINGSAIIGDNCIIRHGVTIGNKEGSKSPIIGNNVNIGAGAKIIGGIKVGNNVTVGANAVVTKDVPDNVVMAGIPAKIISYKTN